MKRKALGQLAPSGAELDSMLSEMSTPSEPEFDAYYCFILTADEAGKVFLNYQSGWKRCTDEQWRIEIREPTKVTIGMDEPRRVWVTFIIYLHICTECAGTVSRVAFVFFWTRERPLFGV